MVNVKRDPNSHQTNASGISGGYATVLNMITTHMSIQNSIAVAMFLVLLAITIGVAIAVRSHFNAQSQEAFEDVVEGALVALQEDIK